MRFFTSSSSSSTTIKVVISADTEPAAKQLADINNNNVDGDGKPGALSASTVEQQHKDEVLGVFGKYLSLWVILCIIAGTAIGSLWPSVAEALDKASVANISFPVAVLLWVMIYPMTLSVDFEALKRVALFPKGILLTTTINWAVQPFVMFGLAYLFFRVIYADVLSTETQKEYVAGAVILGGSPCTAMVFVWSALAHGNASYTLVQVAVNDILILVLYAPTLFLLLGATDIHIPYDTIVLSIVLFVVVPFAAGFGTQRWAGSPEAIQRIEAACKPYTIVALLLTLLLIFIFQGKKVTDEPTDILLIAVPLCLQTLLVFVLAFGSAYLCKLPYQIAAPASFIASSNFFELGVGVAISAYGLESGAALVNVVGVLVEVPVMLFEVWITELLKHHFTDESAAIVATTVTDTATTNKE